MKKQANLNSRKIEKFANRSKFWVYIVVNCLNVCYVFKLLGSLVSIKVCKKLGFKTQIVVSNYNAKWSFSNLLKQSLNKNVI